MAGSKTRTAAAFVSLVALLVAGLVVARAGGPSPTDAPPVASSTSAHPLPDGRTPPTASARRAVKDAYLRQWALYSRAVKTLKPHGLTGALTEKALAAVRREIKDLRKDGVGVRVRVRHHLRVRIADATTAVVIDRYRNRSVAFDQATGLALESDPREVVLEAYTLRKVEGTWKVAAINRLSVAPIKR